jgi:hypothetical protein
VLYKNLHDAEIALKAWLKEFRSFNPALYGQVYPYENTTPSQELERNGRAVYGWGLYHEDEDDIRPRAICIFSIPWA